MEKKLGRNDKCFCGSGKKYKKCCLNKQQQKSGEDISLHINRLKARQEQVRKQQGLGREIISIYFKGTRIVAVGGSIYQSKKWKTFHDFLFEYLRLVFGKQWWLNECSKPYDDRHPVVQWSYLNYNYTKENKRDDKEISTAPYIGSISAYFTLAYNLYLIEHHFEKQIQDRLIHRLKIKEQFTGALYEAYVASIFLLAGLI